MKVPAGARLQRSSLSKALGALSLVSSAIAAVAGGPVFGVVAGAIIAGSVVTHWISRRRRRLHIELLDDSIAIGDHRIPLVDLREGWIEPHETSVTLVLRDRRGDTWRLELEEETVAQLVLEACRLDPKQRSVRMRRQEASSKGAVTAVVAPLVPTIPVAFGLAQMTGSIPLGMLAVAGVGWLINRVLRYSPLIIGADGIRWRDGGKERFVAHRDIRSVTRGRKHQSKNVLVVATDDDEYRIDLGEVSDAHFLATEARVRKLLGGKGHALELLDRGGASLSDWIAKLRKLFGDDVYRGVHIPRERVHETLEDPNASPERRVGAALALVSTANESDAKKVRVRIAEIAESVADEGLAAAFEELATSELREKTLEKLRD